MRRSRLATPSVGRRAAVDRRTWDDASSALLGSGTCRRLGPVLPIPCSQVSPRKQGVGAMKKPMLIMVAIFGLCMLCWLSGLASRTMCREHLATSTLSPDERYTAGLYVDGCVLDS